MLWVATTSKVYSTAYLIDSQTDSTGHQINYQYDSNGNVIRVRDEILVSSSTVPTGDLFSNTIQTVFNVNYLSPTASGDLNGDGIDDPVTVTDTDKLTILLGDPANPLSNQYTISTLPFTPAQVINRLELKDLNGDGKLDIIANAPIDGIQTSSVVVGLPQNISIDKSQASNSIAQLQQADPVLVFLNQGTGQFSAPTVLSLDATSAGFVSGDFNRDGTSDILAYYNGFSANFNGITNPLVLFAGDGNGNYTKQAISLPGIDSTSLSSSYDLAVKTIEIAGKTDLIFNLADRLVVFDRDPSGNWQSIYTNTSNFYSTRFQLVVGDLNRDGSADIVTAGSSGPAQILLGQTNGSFLSQTFNPLDSDLPTIRYLNLTDVNNDGKLDLIFASVNTTSNRFGVKIYDIDAAGNFSQVGNTLSTAVAGYSATELLGLADVNGDSYPDLLLRLSGSSSDYQFGTILNQSVTVNTPVNLIKSYTYDSVFNQLTSETDELGRKTLYNLDPITGKVIKTTRIVGQQDSLVNGETDDIATSYTYTSKNQLDLMTDALGHVTNYDYDTYGNLVKLTTAEGTSDQAVEQYRYDLAGNRTASIDALGHETDYIYNSLNMLLQTIDAVGATTTYNYDRMGHQTSMTDALGHATKMTYDRRGRLETTTDASGGITTNAYDNNGNLKSVTDALGHATQYRYDARNRLIATINADGGTNQPLYDLNNNQIGSIDSLGHKTQQFYDVRNRLSREIDAMGNQTKYAYDAANELISTTDAKGHTTTYQYDELGRQIATIDPSLHTTRTEYDKLGNVTATVDANNNRTEYTYDALNRQVRVKDAQNHTTLTTYDKVGDVLSVTDALNHTTSYAYDRLNRQISQTDALNHTSSTAYDKVGNVISTTDALNHTTSYGYDNLNRKISTLDALNQTQSVIYDKVGNVTSQTDELGHTTTYGYDLMNRQMSITDPLLHTSTTRYDTEGNVLSTTDALNHTTSYLYDWDNRKIQVIDASSGITKTSYDEVGNVAAITDSDHNTTTYTYDLVNRLITDTNQLGKTRTHSYDNVGNLTRTLDRDGRKIAYNYDTLNRQTAEKWLDASNATIKTFSSGYDAVGHLLTSTNPDASYSYSYDAVDRISSIDNTGTVGVPAVKFNYSYDAVGNLIAVNDSINGTNAGITGYTYDLLNRVTKLTQAGTRVQSKRVDMAYNAVNQLTTLSRFSGVNPVVDTNYTYDLNQRLSQLSHKKGVSTVASYDYSYDNADKLAATVSSVDGTSSYSYDATNQLTGASHTSQTNEAYAYDANGNRTSGGTVTSANNQLNSDGTYSYTYDDEGNRTQRTEIATGKVTEYVWDYRNRLGSVLFKDAGGVVAKTIDYIYDGDNQRIGKRIDGAVTERYVIDRNQIALVFDGAGNQTHRYLYGTTVDQVLADETPASTNWFLADNEGSINSTSKYSRIWTRKRFLR